MNYDTGLYQPYAVRMRGFINYIMVCVIVAAGLFLTSCVSDYQLPKWLTGEPTKTELVETVAQLQSDVITAQAINEDLEKTLVLQEDLKTIEVDNIYELKEAVQVVKKTYTAAKAKSVKKIEEIAANTELTEVQKDEQTLDEIVASMTLAHSLIPSVKRLAETQKG